MSWLIKSWKMDGKIWQVTIITSLFQCIKSILSINKRRRRRRPEEENMRSRLMYRKLCRMKCSGTKRDETAVDRQLKLKFWITIPEWSCRREPPSKSCLSLFHLRSSLSKILNNKELQIKNHPGQQIKRHPSINILVWIPIVTQLKPISKVVTIKNNKYLHKKYWVRMVMMYQLMLRLAIMLASPSAVVASRHRLNLLSLPIKHLIVVLWLQLLTSNKWPRLQEKAETISPYPIIRNQIENNPSKLIKWIASENMLRTT